MTRPRGPLNRPTSFTPRDPSKPFGRSGRTVMVYVRQGGRLRKVRSLLRGVRGTRVDPDPKRYYWILEPPKDKRGSKMKERMVLRRTIDSLVEKGMLRSPFAEPDEITVVDLTPEGIHASKRTDENGNWLPEGVEQAYPWRRRAKA